MSGVKPDPPVSLWRRFAVGRALRPTAAT